MNFITEMPPSFGVDRKAYDAISVVVDCYTKLAKYYPVLKKIIAEQFDNFLVHIVFCNFGVPLSIVSKQGSNFTSTFWLTLCYYSHIKRCLNMAFDLHTNGQTKR